MPSIAKLNHIGIAVEAPAALSRLFGLLGLSIDHVEAVPDQGVNTHFLPLQPAKTSLELLEPIDPEGPVGKFIQKRGQGVHHLSFEVEPGQLDALCAKLRAEGIRLTYDIARPGAHGMRINFVHPSSASGVLIELMEKA